MTDPETLDPNEIRHLPIRRDLPLNGLTPEQVRAIGHDPDEIEAGRLAAREHAAAEARVNEAQLLAAATQAVAEGELTHAEAAAALHGAGFDAAHTVFVQEWQREEAELAAIDDAAEAAWLDPNEYVQRFAARLASERAQLEQNAATAKRTLEIAQLQALKDQYERFVQSTPGAYEIAPAVEAQIMEQVRRDGLPSTEAAGAAMIETALKTTTLLATEQESLKQQVDTEWRVRSKTTLENGRTRGDLTAADVARAEAIFKQSRFAELAAEREKTIDLNALRPGPTAEDESTALAERYRARQAASTAFAQNAADIAGRGIAAPGSDRGVASAANRDAYKQAYRRAEHRAAHGENVPFRLSTDPQPAEATVKPGGYGPDGTWPDTLGPAI